MSIFWLAALLTVSMDQLSKYLVIKKLGLDEVSPIIFNQGISWGSGIFSGWEKLIDIIFLLFFFWWWKRHASQTKLSQISWGLLLGGGLSNMLDRFFYGGVVDWWRWETLGFTNNLADVLIFLAVIGIIAGELLENSQKVEKQK